MREGEEELDVEKLFAKDAPISSIYEYDVLRALWNTIVSMVSFVVKICGIYLLWICLHYLAAQLYIQCCVPTTMIGFMMSPFMVSTPHCQALRWIVYNAATMINHMWFLLGSFVYSLLWIEVPQTART